MARSGSAAGMVPSLAQYNGDAVIMNACHIAIRAYLLKGVFSGALGAVHAGAPRGDRMAVLASPDTHISSSSATFRVQLFRSDRFLCFLKVSLLIRSYCCFPCRAMTVEPQRVVGLTGVPVVQVSAGGYHSVCVTRTGHAYSWGRYAPSV